MVDWKDNLKQLVKTLACTEAETYGRVRVDTDQAFALWCDWACSTRTCCGTVFFAGNGASASMACHFSADLAKNAWVRTQVFTDPSLLTAIGNDVSYAEVFSEPLRWFARKGDLLVTVSSSGNSPNVVRALEVAREKGMRSVALCAMGKDNASRALSDLCFYVPASTYGQAETAHGAILHHWMDLMEASAK